MLTVQQETVLRRLDSGLIWDDLDESEQEIVRFFLERGEAVFRSDLKCGLVLLSETGRMRLHTEQQKKRDNKKANRRDNINLAIALLALLVSLAGFVLQLVSG